MPTLPPVIAKYKNFIILGAAVLVLGFIAMSFMGGDATAPAGSDATGDGSQPTPTDTESAQIERELLDELLRLRDIELNESLFGNALFISLVDFSKPLVEQPVGRSNPFAPIQQGSAVTPAPADTPADTQVP